MERRRSSDEAATAAQAGPKKQPEGISPALLSLVCRRFAKNVFPPPMLSGE